MSARTQALILMVVITFTAGIASAKVVIGPLEPTQPNVGVLFAPTDQKIKISVTDERPDKDFTARALVGPAAEKGKGIFLGYGTQREDDLARFVEAAATDAVEVLGMKNGDGPLLEITIVEFIVDMYRISGFSPANCIGYGTIHTVLKSPDGAPLVEKQLKLAFYEHRTPKGSMKEVSTHALSRIYMQAAWQATAETLLDHFDLTPDEQRVQAVLDALDTFDKQVQGRQAIFWLGIARLESPAVHEKLLSVFRTEEEQKVHQAAAEALGLLGVTDAREDIEALLAGTKILDAWNIEDNEHVWYLLRSLALLGETDLTPHMPTGEMRMRSKIEDLIRFQKTGELPQADQATLEKLEKARQALAKKRSR